DNKNRLERKPEQSSTTFQDIPTSEKQIAVQLFKTKIQDLAQQIHEKELKTIINQMSEYIETSKKLLDQIETHRNNKPFNPFKLKAWEGELANLVHQHDNEIKAKYNHLKTEHQRIKNRGVVSEHWQKAESLIQQKYPDEYKKIKQLERELNEKNATVSIARTQEQDNGRGR
ncbi:mobilization protein (MobL-like), partial (plasmid) [Acinetobacter sp. TR3]